MLFIYYITWYDRRILIALKQFDRFHSQSLCTLIINGGHDHSFSQLAVSYFLSHFDIKCPLQYTHIQTNGIYLLITTNTYIDKWTLFILKMIDIHLKFGLAIYTVNCSKKVHAWTSSCQNLFLYNFSKVLFPLYSQLLSIVILGQLTWFLRKKF